MVALAGSARGSGRRRDPFMHRARVGAGARREGRIEMERSLFRYILHHTWRDQVWLLVITAVSFPLIYVNLELPKMIVNGAISGKNLPTTVFGFDITQIEYLMVLSLTLLALITLNGAIKYYLNVYRGVVGERMVRRLRYDLCRSVLRFPLPHFKKTSAGEIIPMITAETDPIGGFIGDSIALPAFQGGILLTYLVFIFVQDFWLGVAAVALYPPQVWLIPKLQRKINQLSKSRIQTTRQLSDRIGDTIAGAAEIRANDTSRYELADVSDRLGTIYGIRFDIYKRKFFVKFLNNFLAQITPFFFYSIGGYFVIRGELSLGALVAVLAAYKDLIDPWKEILKWYETKEDVRVKYEQIVSQFEPPDLIARELVDNPPETVPRLSGSLVASGLTYSEDGSANDVDRVTFEIRAGEHVALIGVGKSGKDDVARLLARLTFPTSGRVAIGEVNLASAHGAVTGRRIAYEAQNAHIFSGTLLHNLLYGLKHRPVSAAVYDEEEAERQRRRTRDALTTANSPEDIRADWVDFEGAGIADGRERALSALRLVAMDNEVLAFGLASKADPEIDGGLVARVLEARAKVRSRVGSPELARLVELFDRDRYHTNISIGENLLFGTPRAAAFQYDNLARNAEVLDLLRDVGLLADFEAVGVKVAKLMVELFADVPADSELFAQYSFINPEDLEDFQALLRKIDDRGFAALAAREKEMLVALPFRIVVGRHRLGVCDEPMQQRVVEARAEFRRRYAGRDVVEFFDPERFSPALSIQDNILFGRPVYEQANAQARVTDLIREVAIGVGMEAMLITRGLDFDVGASGARLSYSQKQRLAIARGLMKNADVLILNEPTSGLDPGTERVVLAGVLDWAKDRTVVWALGRADLAQSFQRVLVLDGGRLVEEGAYAELATSGAVLPKLLAGV